jgi:hypothetical protein
MAKTRRWFRFVLVAVFAPLATGCEPEAPPPPPPPPAQRDLGRDMPAVAAETAAYQISVLGEAGARRIEPLGRLEGPRSQPVCEAGANEGRSKPVGAAGDTVQLNPPQSRRPSMLQVRPQQGAPPAPFILMESGATYPEIQVNGPPNRPVSVTLSASGCAPFNGPLILFERVGNDWVRAPQQQAAPDGLSVTAEFQSLRSRYALGVE